MKLITAGMLNYFWEVVKTHIEKVSSPGEATQSKPGLLSVADKKKLDGIDEGANKTTVDSALDRSSTNPVQNKVVKAALDGKVSGKGLKISFATEVPSTLTDGEIVLVYEEGDAV